MPAEQPIIFNEYDPSLLKLQNGSHIAVIGGGPAGTIFSYFLLDLALRAGTDIHVDIYESKDFNLCGPRGCNHCGGIVSESLVQLLSTEGINIPSNVVQRGINSYVLHMDHGNVRINTPIEEKRIAAVHRGKGPLGATGMGWGSFDNYLLKLNEEKGANVIRDKVISIDFNEVLPIVTTKKGLSKKYDLIAGAVGINTTSFNLFEKLDMGFTPPTITKTYICEFALGKEMVRRYFGSSMHVFLLNIPRMEFAAFVPKQDYVTLVMLGEDIDKEVVGSFLENPEVKNCFPEDWDLSGETPCKCFPKINIKGVARPYADRVVLLGDCGITKLYKNGIGAAYITAKAAAAAAVLNGISGEDFKNNYLPTCRSMHYDNCIGRFIFSYTRVLQKLGFVKKGILRLVAKEQSKKGASRHMSMALWDTFTGSAPYIEIFKRFFNPILILNLIWNSALGLLPRTRIAETKEIRVGKSELGRLYTDGEIIIKQGEPGDCLYVIQKGRVDVLMEDNGKEVFLTELKERDFFGEIALFERVLRSSTVRAKGDVRVLTVDKKALLSRVQADPSLAFRIIQKMSKRIRELSDELRDLK